MRFYHPHMLIQSPYVPANLVMSVPDHVCVASTNYIVLFNLNVEIIDIKQHATRVNLGATIVFVCAKIRLGMARCMVAARKA